MSEIKQIGYDSVLTSGGTLLVAFAAMKLMGERMGVLLSTRGMFMLALAIFLRNIFVNWLQKSKYISPDLQ